MKKTVSRMMGKILWVFLLSLLLVGLINVEVASAKKATGALTYGGTQREFACQVIQTDDNGFVLVGSTNSFGAGLIDF